MGDLEFVERRGAGGSVEPAVEGEISYEGRVCLGRVAGLSVEGLRVLLDALPPEGGEIRVALGLPRSARRLTLDAVLEWHEPSDLPGYFDCGLRFRNVDAPRAQALRELLEAARIDG